METSTTQSSLVCPQPFHLAAGGALQPAMMLGQAFPARISGLDAFYYWKDAIVVGSYTHPNGGASLDITRDRLDGYIAAFERMKSNGVGVPILMDHAPSAAATLGWIVEIKRDGDRLMELHQFLGAEARDIGLRNKVSLGIDPDFIDGHGNHYGEAIVHSAITPLPVVPDQGDFEAAGAVLTLSLADDEEEGNDAIVEARESSLAVSRAQADSPAKPQATAARVSQGEDSDGQLALCSFADAAAIKRDIAIARGAIDPVVATELFSLLVRDEQARLRTMTLSRQGNDPHPLALAIFDVLARNRPAVLGEATPLQVLSRVTPDDEGASAELRMRMIALASGCRT